MGEDEKSHSEPKINIVPLKGSPFHAEDTPWIEVNLNNRDKMKYRVRCGYIFTDWFDSTDEVVSFWNNRVGDDVPVEDDKMESSLKDRIEKLEEVRDETIPAMNDTYSGVMDKFDQRLKELERKIAGDEHVQAKSYLEKMAESQMQVAYGTVRRSGSSGETPIPSDILNPSKLSADVLQSLIDMQKRTAEDLTDLKRKVKVLNTLYDALKFLYDGAEVERKNSDRKFDGLLDRLRNVEDYISVLLNLKPGVTSVDFSKSFSEVKPEQSEGGE